MCIAVGNVSFDDCDMLTWSFGWMGFFEPISPPASSIARFEITSLTFMFVCVPEPVCQTRSGKCSYSLPAITSSAAWVMSFAFSSSSLPRSRLTSAAAFLSCAIARMISRGITSRGVASSPMSKWIERARRLRAVIFVGGDVDLPHGVGLDAGASDRAVRLRGGHSKARFGGPGSRHSARNVAREKWAAVAWQNWPRPKAASECIL